jgi:hypothetical protein
VHHSSGPADTSATDTNNKVPSGRQYRVPPSESGSVYIPSDEIIQAAPVMPEFMGNGPMQIR